MATLYQREPFQISNLPVWWLNPTIPVLGLAGLPNVFQVEIRGYPTMADSPLPMLK